MPLMETQMQREICTGSGQPPKDGKFWPLFNGSLRGDCAVCGRWVTLKKDGMARKHETRWWA